jgi:hypothetical protein
MKVSRAFENTLQISTQHIAEIQRETNCVLHTIQIPDYDFVVRSIGQRDQPPSEDWRKHPSRSLRTS